MPSKMRIMRKMMNSGGSTAQNRLLIPYNSSNRSVQTGAIRVCSDCNTTKTPLWRSGPQGPKARRAMEAAGLIPAAEQTKARKEKIVQSECTIPFKKRCKFTSAQPRKKLHFDEFTMSISNSSAFHGVFPQDEKDAAVLLMGLSYGLIRS
ncbi:unnamed protein product [Spirodela intermedia]|uniref:GATA-type domain-containing protein n=1 Tax=Spirodela intermedia TaxID=51605 RepID=A0A7I8JQH1_SPIIN|nr:unnamed protein product [Spirodela intermedia]CAA6671672.1 unnamed protein product [Spirodela intermedia]